MFDAPLASILNNGLLGALLVLSLLVIAWQQRRYDSLSEKRFQEAVDNRDTIARVVSEQTETQRISAEKMSSMAESMKTIASAMYQNTVFPPGRKNA